MNPLHNTIQKLNISSQNILTEIDSKEPSFNSIKFELEQRDILVKHLGNLTIEYPSESLSEEERASLKYLFITFVELNDNIQKNLQKLLNTHKEKLGTAVTQRKVGDRYNVLKNPDISYF